MSNRRFPDQIGNMPNSSRTLDYEGEDGDTRVRDIIISRSLEEDERRGFIDVNAVLAQCKEETWSGRHANDCPICLEKLVNYEKVCRLPCDHIFHRDCLVPWIEGHHDQCPVCRAQILPQCHDPNSYGIQYVPVTTYDSPTSPPLDSHVPISIADQNIHPQTIPIGVSDTEDNNIHDVPVQRPIPSRRFHDVLYTSSDSHVPIPIDNGSIHPQTIPKGVSSDIENNDVHDVPVQRQIPSRRFHEVLYTSGDNIIHPSVHPSSIETTFTDGPMRFTNDPIYPQQHNVHNVPIIPMTPTTSHMTHTIPINENLAPIGGDHDVQHIPIDVGHVQNVPNDFTHAPDAHSSRNQQDSSPPQDSHVRNEPQLDHKVPLFTASIVILNPKPHFPTPFHLAPNALSSPHTRDQSMVRSYLLSPGRLYILGKL